MARVLLSHASADKPVVRQIATALRAAGHDPWLDEEQILVGESIAAAVERGLRAAHFVVVCLSNAAEESGWVEAERAATWILQLRERKVRILPVRLEDVMPPLFIATLAHVDLFPDEQAFTQGIARLTRSIEGHQARHAGRQPGPLVDPDRDIVDLVARDNLTGALRCLMQRYGASVYRYCREALLDAAVAQDVHQQVFLTAFRDLRTFRGDSTVRTRLFGIAQDRVLDAARRRQRARSHIDHSNASVRNTRPCPEQRLEDAQLQEALVEGLAKLPTDALAAVLLRFQQGFSFDGMATICNEKPGTLEFRVLRAISRLRTYIERQIEDPIDAATAQRRQRRERTRSPVDDSDASVQNTRLCPEEWLEDARLPEALIEGLAKLPTHVLAAVLLRFQQGFSFEGVATICNEKPGTLEFRAMRAVSTLRTCIERRIEDAITRLGAEHVPPPGWEVRILHVAATHLNVSFPAELKNQNVAEGGITLGKDRVQAATHVTLRRRSWWYAGPGLAAAAALALTIVIHERPTVDHESVATTAAYATAHLAR